MGDFIAKIPKSEDVAVTYRTADHVPLYKITVNKKTMIYSLYKIVDGGFERLGKGPNPNELEKKYIKRGGNNAK